MVKKQYVIGAKIPEALNDELQKMMATSGKNSSQVIRDALEYYIEQDRILTRLNAIEAQNKIVLRQTLNETLNETLTVMLNDIKDALIANNKEIDKLFAD